MLVVLAIPPILTNTYAGVQNVDPAVRDAARGMGMTGSEVVRKVELPCALPLILSGVRSATLQVLATATIAAYVPLLGGLGSRDLRGDQTITDPKTGYPAMVAAGMLVAVLAVLVDVLLVGAADAGGLPRPVRPLSATQLPVPELNGRPAASRPRRGGDHHQVQHCPLHCPSAHVTIPELQGEP